MCRRLLVLPLTLWLVVVPLAVAEESSAYTLKSQDKTELKHLLAEFNQLTTVKESRGIEQDLEEILPTESHCCDYAQVEDPNRYVFDGTHMKIKGREIRFEELSTRYKEFELNSKAKHTFSIAGDYFLDVEELSLIAEEDEGSSWNVIFRLKYPNGVTVLKGVKSCWC